jgi:hypothetical protein
LFGDSSNQKLAKEISINHVNSDELANTELCYDFQKVYKIVKGKKANDEANYTHIYLLRIGMR